jgi:hypothetical protein
MRLGIHKFQANIASIAHSLRVIAEEMVKANEQKKEVKE